MIGAVVAARLSLGRGLVARMPPRPLPRMIVPRALSGAPPPAADSVVWKQVKNAQGRVFYQREDTGERSWERPQGKEVQVVSLEEQRLRDEELRESVKVAEADKAAKGGGSLVMLAIDHFWSLVDLARKGYWVGIAGAGIYVAYELVLLYWS